MPRLAHTVPLSTLVPRPRLLLFFGLCSASVYYTEHKPKNENRGGLGTRLAPIYLSAADEGCQNAFCMLGDCRCNCV